MKKILGIILVISMITFLSNTCYADVGSGAKTYSITIPSATTVVLSDATSTFGSISSSDFGTGNTAAHTISIGDGTAGSASYVQSNDPTAGAKQYTVTFGGNYKSNSLATSSGKAKITVESASPAASVDVLISNSAQSGMPALGTVNFAISGDTLNIPINSSVTFTSAKAPLNMKLDLDESTLGYDDSATTLSVIMTLTAVGLN